MTLSAYFMSKSVFDQQGCHALTFALARLSCFSWGKLTFYRAILQLTMLKYWQISHQEVKLNVHVFAKTTGVVISECLCVAKRLTHDET